MENDVVRKLMEDYKWKEEGFTAGYGGNVLSKKEEWGEPNGFQIDEKNCEFKWFARRDENKKIFKLKTPEQYTRAITELIKACQDKELPCYEYPSPPNYQSGLRITIIDETNGSQTDDEKADAVNEWKKNHLKEFLELKENVLKKIKEEAPMSQEEQMNEIKELLVNNHNIILHGAPGTGKTYLAKDIAIDLIFENENDRKLIRKKEEEIQAKEKETYQALNAQLNEQYCFVQFHQSYDYTDFVEGLRPKDDGKGNIVFERKDGVFKEFCKKAIGAHFANFEPAYKNFIEDLKKNNGIKLQTLKQKKSFSVRVNSNDNLYATPDTKAATDMPVTKELLKVYVETGEIKDWKPYVTAIGEYLKENYSLGDLSIDDSQKEKKYIFIIDEINRGEMSKIFGELFYSIDPGYRGTKGRIKTQYQNLIDDKHDVFVDGFYVPENVYIIGTMNDIDRSVESMDFAMRRRFAFKEITAEQSKTMLDKPDSWKNGNGEKIDVLSCLDDIKKQMDNLNNAILNKEFNLGQAYQIGGAYFLKFANYCKTDDNKKAVENQDEAYKSLWTNHLECVIREYLRGMDNVEGKDGKLEKLKDAYDFKVIYKDDGTIDTNAKNGKPSAEAKDDHVDGKDKQTEETDA